MKKSLSLLVAIAMVFSMFATVVSAAEEPTAGEYLNELGVILGNQDGDLKEDQTWKRQDVAVLLSRLLGVEDEAKDADKTHEFTDVTDANYDGYISWAVEEGLFEGKGDGKFGFGAELKAQELYALILRVFGEDTTGENYANVPELAVEYGFATEDTDFAAVPKRGETYVVVVAALKTEVEPGVTLEQKLGLVEVTELTVSAAATGVKKITLTFNQAVDKSKASVTVKNNNITVNVKEAVWAENNKSVVLEFANNLAAADYTVTVSGLSEKDLTSTVKVEAQKVAKIEFQSDKAPLARGVSNEITVGYVVTNQYGEDISNGTSLTATSSKGTASASNGTVTVTIGGSGFYNINETVHVSLLHVDGAYASVATTVSAEARVAAVEISKLHQADGKILEVGGAAPNTFKLVLGLKDQYGNNVSNAANATDDVIITVSNPVVASLVGHTTTTQATITSESIDGSNKLVLTVNGPLTAGTSVVTVMSKSTGARATFDLVVKDSVKVDTLTLSAPASAPAGAVVEIPFTAVDQFGNAIEQPTNAQINLGNSSISNGTFTGFVKDVVKNTTSLKVTLPVTKGPAIVTVLTGTNKFVQLTINVTDAPVVTVISGTKDFSTSTLKTDVVPVGTGNIVVKDQYNANITPDYSTLVAQDGKYRIALTSSNTSVVSINNDGKIYSNQGVELTAVAKGTATITVKLEKATVGTTTTWTEVANSSYSYTQKVVEKGDIASYEATVAGTIYTDATETPTGYSKALEVKGVLQDGSKVVIPVSNDNYEVSINQAGLTHAAGKLQVTNTTNIGFGDKDTKEVAINVLVKGATTEIIPVTVLVSKAAPVIEKFEVKTNNTDGVTKESDTTVSISKANLVTLATPVDLARAAVKLVDQYGVEYTTVAHITAAVSTLPASFADAEVGKTYTVSATTNNNKPVVFTVIVK